MYDDVTGIILSGGKSKRMGINKSLLKVGDKTIIEIMKDFMHSLFKNVILITNEPDDYKFLKLPIYRDIFEYKGPLAGIHSGLTNSTTEKNFIISCDIPLISTEMIEYITNYPTDKLIKITKAEGYIQQLCGLYSKECLGPAEEILKSQQIEEVRNSNQHKRGCKALDLVSKIDAEIINAESLPFYTSDLFFNMNRKDDYKYVLKRLGEKKLLNKTTT